MSSASKKIIAVVGATGNQGSSVAHTFLGLPNWHVRCLTRNPSSPASQELTSLGAEVVKADLSDPSSLAQAFENANAIFLNTDFWGPYTAARVAAASGTQGNEGKSPDEIGFETEVSHGKNAAIAAAAVTSLERLVYSALPPLKKHSKGKWQDSHHWDSKAAVLEYIENEQPHLAKKSSFIYLGGFTTNPFLVPRSIDPAGEKYALVLPMKKETKMPVIDPRESTGPFVRALIEDEAAGTRLLAYDENLVMGEVAGVWSRVTGKETLYIEVSVDIMHEKYGVPLQVLAAPGFIEEFGYMGGVEDFIEPSQLKTKVQTKSFEDWLKERDWKKVMEAAKFRSQS